MDVRLAPFHDLTELRPVVDLLEFHLLHRCARDDEPVEVAVLHLLEGLVEGEHVLLRGVFGRVAVETHQLHLHLNRGVAEQAHWSCRL